MDAASLQARTQPIDGVRLAQSQQAAATADTYQEGRALLAAGDVTGAISAFRGALVEAPQSVDALNGLAVAYDRLGRYDISRSWYDAALAIDPDAALVLNNLGYSLFLQGEYRAAIPLLQRAVASNDAGARSGGQRVLNLIAARMRADVAEASTAIALAEVRGTPVQVAPVQMARADVVAVPAPRARIEVASNGEQRLVLAAPAPDAALTASLGEAAALVMVARPWTGRDETALAAREAAIAAREAAAVRAEMAAQVAVAERVAVREQLREALIAVRMADAAPVSPVAPEDRAPARQLVVAAAPRAVVMAAPRAAVVNVASDGMDAAPAWLLASRRSETPAPAGAVAGHALQGGGDAGFDSDDGALNAFAARMRGEEAPAAVAVAVSVEEAVARLEMLLRRIRSA